MLIHDKLVRRLTKNADMLAFGDWDISYDKYNQLELLLLSGDGFSVKCARGFEKFDNYHLIWKDGLLNEIYFNGKLLHRIFYDVNKRGQNAGLPALYMVGFGQISRYNDGLLYLLAGYLGRIPDAKVDSIETYDLESGKLKYNRKVDSKFDFKGRLSEYTMQEYREYIRIDTITSTLKLVY